MCLTSDPNLELDYVHFPMWEDAGKVNTDYINHVKLCVHTIKQDEKLAH